MHGLNDPLFESLRAAILAALIVYLVVFGRHSRFARHPGAWLIITGFVLVFIAAVFDVTDEIPGLERYVIIGATPFEVYLETIGYLAGFLCLFGGFVNLVPAVARLEKVEQDLRDSEARFRLIFESSPDPLIIARADGSGILEVNQAFVSGTGISKGEAWGKTSADLNIWVEPAQRDEFLALLRKHGAVVNFEARLRRRDGEVRTCLASAQLITLDGVLCMLLGTRDITRQKEAENALLEMDRMKSDFISTAAHELRTPLATMLGYTELLRESEMFGNFSEERRTEFLDEIYQKGEALSRIVDEMLDVSLIESGHSVALDLQPQVPSELLGKIVRRFELQNPKHRFRLELPGEQPGALRCDLHRITQVLDNLLSNAVKYSPRGGMITLCGQLVDSVYMVSVSDQGIGMTQEQLERVFDKFYRADSSNTAISGLGLGMSIAQQIVELHGGKIWVESTVGEGAKVSFSLPVDLSGEEIKS
jgi:PAS domain S-box-containing protein